MRVPLLVLPRTTSAVVSVVFTTRWDREPYGEDVLVVRTLTIGLGESAKLWWVVGGTWCVAEEEIRTPRVHPERMGIRGGRQATVVAEEQSVAMRVRKLGRKRHRRRRCPLDAEVLEVLRT